MPVQPCHPISLYSSRIPSSILYYKYSSIINLNTATNHHRAHPHPALHHLSTHLTCTRFTLTSQPIPSALSMCIPHIEIIPSPSPRRHHRGRPTEPLVPLSAECTNPLNRTSYVSISPRIIYTAPSSRSSLPRTHRPSSSKRESLSLEVEFVGGVLAGREVVDGERKNEREKEKEKEREREKQKGKEMEKEKEKEKNRP